MGELIKIDFSKNISTNKKAEREEKISLTELYNKVTATKLNPEIVASFSEILKQYTFDELLEFMAQNAGGKEISESKLPFVKAVQREIRNKQPAKKDPL